MADSLSVAASVVGISATALQSVQFLFKTIDYIKDVPDTVKSIKVDLQAVELVLRHLDTALQGDVSHLVPSDEIKVAVENCARACTAFQTLLGHWMRHSIEEKMFWMDRWRLGLFGQDRIKTFKEQLNDCKGTLSVALSAASVYVSSPMEWKYAVAMLVRLAYAHRQYHNDPPRVPNERDEGYDAAAE
jgi:hypothetical protein